MKLLRHLLRLLKRFFFEHTVCMLEGHVLVQFDDFPRYTHSRRCRRCHHVQLHWTERSRLELDSHGRDEP